MKKATLFLALIVTISTVAKAQFNKTLGSLYNDLGNARVTLSEDGRNLYYVTEHKTDPLVDYNQDGLLVVKTDLSGNMINNVVIPVYGMAPNIISTYDNGILVAVNTFNSQGLYVFKLDASLTELWNIQVALAFTPPINYSDRSDVALLKGPAGEGHGSGTYYVGYNTPSFSSYQSTYPQDYTFSVLRLTENGIMLFNKTYADVNRLSQPFDQLYDNINSLTMIPYTDYETDGRPQIVIGGMRRQDIWGMFKEIPFMMKIDKDGNVISPYRDYLTMGYSGDYHYIMWDNAQKSLVGVYADQNVFAGPYFVHPATGLLLSDDQLNVVDSRYYFYNSYLMLAPRSITQDNEGNYIIGEQFNYSKYSSDVSPYFSKSVNCPALLQLNKSSLNAMNCRYYDLPDYTFWCGNHVHHPTSGSNYMVADVKTTPLVRNHLIGVNSGLRTDCDAYVPIDNITYMPTPADYTYVAKDNPIYVSIDAPLVSIAMKQDACGGGVSHPTDPDSKPQQQMATVPLRWSANIYPTLLQAASSNITCAVNSPEDGTVHITITNTLGQTIYSADHAAHTGSTLLQLSTPYMPAGMYVARISTNNKLLNTVKISVTE